MFQNQSSSLGITTLLSAMVNAIVLQKGFTDNSNWYWALLITAPALLFLYIKLRMQKKNKGVLLDEVKKACRQQRDLKVIKTSRVLYRKSKPITKY